MTQAPMEKFRNLLRELFQFDCADLDFGIYRIMNHKRAVIERFWDEAARTLTIPFEYLPLTAQETITYGQKNQQEFARNVW